MQRYFKPPSKRLHKGETIDFEIYKNGHSEKAPAVMLTDDHGIKQCQLLGTNEIFFLSPAAFSIVVHFD